MKLSWYQMLGMMMIGTMLVAYQADVYALKKPSQEEKLTVVFHPLSQKKQKPIIVQAELVQTKEKLERGLMYRKELAPFSGMLFSFPTLQRTRFWMKNTYIPLDLIFFNERFQIVGIEENMIPLDETPKGPDELVRYVLEVNAGFCKKHKIRFDTKADVKFPSP